MQGQDEFAARLGRINAGKRIAATAGPGAPPPPPVPPSGGDGRGRAPNPGLKFALIMVPVVGLVGGLMAISVLTDLPNQMKAEVSARLAGDTPGPTESGPNWITQLFFREPAVLPEDFLPEAPTGWMRVTASDAAGKTAEELANSMYPGEVEGRAWYPVEQNIGYQRFEHFVSLRSEPDMEQNVLARSYGSAVFMSTDGMFLRATLRVAGEHGFFGSEDAPEEWLDYVERRANRSASVDEVVERVTIAGMPAINRTEPKGKSLLRRPIGEDYGVPNSLELTVPLWHRAYIEVVGMASPDDVSELVGRIDLDALRDTYR